MVTSNALLPLGGLKTRPVVTAVSSHGGMQPVNGAKVFLVVTCSSGAKVHGGAARSCQGQRRNAAERQQDKDMCLQPRRHESGVTTCSLRHFLSRSRTSLWPRSGWDAGAGGDHIQLLGGGGGLKFVSVVEQAASENTKCAIISWLLTQNRRVTRMTHTW